MTALAIPCALEGCPNPRRDNSIYCSKQCANKASKLRERERRHLEPRKAQLHRCGIYGTNKTVEIRDPLCGAPYRITRTEYKARAREYRELGIKAFEDGKEV